MSEHADRLRIPVAYGPAGAQAAREEAADEIDRLVLKAQVAFEVGYRIAYETHCTEIDESHYAAMLKFDRKDFDSELAESG